VKLIGRRRAADAALAAFREREREWTRGTHVLRAWAGRHRAAVIAGGGFAAGIAASLLPVARVMRLVSAAAGTISLLIEGPLLRMLLARRHAAPAGGPDEPGGASA
jgi:hypothetical protein